MGKDKDATRRVKSSELNKKAKNKKSKKGNKVKFKDKHPKAARIIKITLIVLILLLIIGAGILVGAFFGVFGDELKIDESSLVVGYENSTVYDSDGNLIATLSGGTKRKSISLDEMSEYLPKAYVAIEDERFYSHCGIDVGRTVYATITYILHGGKSSFGGSTITQQVIKNITQEKDNTALAGVLRKVKEISKAIQVEHYLSKDQILELYLNLIFVGGDDINGVELGAIYYFNKSAKDLSIAECAYMAGINNSPNAYKPFEDYDGDKEKQEAMTEKINTRTKTVLSKMLELEYITEDQYNEAVAEVDAGLNFEKGEAASVTTDVSYVTEAAIEQIIDQILEENEDMSRDMAELNLYSGGYKIYTTQDSEIQAILEEEIVKSNYFSSYSEKETDEETGETETVYYYSTPTMVIQDYTTGKVVAAATATGSEEERTATTKLGYLNIPTEIKKQTGSSMKPISVIAPGLESGTITGATVYYNLATTWGTGSNAWSPKNSTGYTTYSNMRAAIEQSYNIPNAKALSDIGLDTAVDFCLSIGLPDFSEEGLSLALGGLNEGISPADMASAYSVIANDGVYINQIFYTKVEDSEGNIVYEPEQEETRVMSEQNAYIEKDILKGVVTQGTATYCAISGIDVAAKTGTTNSSNDRWLCGFTPYYSAACWYGYEYSSTVTGFSGNPAGKLWAAVMSEIHEDLDNATFEEPDGIVRQTVCRISGKLPSETCTDCYVELFTEDTVPTEMCEGHSAYGICADSGLLATEYCTNVTQSVTYVPERERNAIWVTEGVSTSMPTEFCTLHTAPAVTETIEVVEETNNVVENTTTSNSQSSTATNTQSTQQPSTTQNTASVTNTQSGSESTVTNTTQSQTTNTTNPETTDPAATPDEGDGEDDEDGENSGG